jgi:hypothetical protein
VRRAGAGRLPHARRLRPHRSAPSQSAGVQALRIWIKNTADAYTNLSWPCCCLHNIYSSLRQGQSVWLCIKLHCHVSYYWLDQIQLQIIPYPEGEVDDMISAIQIHHPWSYTSLASGTANIQHEVLVDSRHLRFTVPTEVTTSILRHGSKIS